MNVTPFGQMADQVANADREAPPKKPSESSPMKSFTNIQSEQTIRAAELINNAMKSSKAASGDATSDYYSGYITEAKANKAGNLREGRKLMRKGFQQKRPPLWVAILILLGVLTGTAYYIGWGPFEKPKEPVTVDGMIKAGRYEKARELLEKRTSLTAADQDRLSLVYVKLAKQYGDEGDYVEALKLLRKVQPKSKAAYDEAHKLIKDYRSK
jgi:tetratricopeptide (TPR) repeat protein